ncbi:MAG: hypothetical protein ACREOU_09595 [Candidatus Eiseniibacteriota bacterium]
MKTRRWNWLPWIEIAILCAAFAWARDAEALEVHGATITVSPASITCPPDSGTATVVVELDVDITATDVAIGTTVTLLDADALPLDDGLVTLFIPAADVGAFTGVPGRGVLTLTFTVHCNDNCRIEGWNDATGDLVEVVWDPGGPGGGPPAETHGPYPPTRVDAEPEDEHCAQLAVEVSGEGFENFGSATVCCEREVPSRGTTWGRIKAGRR